MVEDLSWAPPGVDASRASAARVYDYWLGGTHNFQADRDAARALIAVEPNARGFARQNRAFLVRAVRFMARAGVRQFLDIGSGIPTQSNVHQVARSVAPAARVVYVDCDPVAVAHSRAILGTDPGSAVIQADLRDPTSILSDAAARRLLNPAEPTGLMLGAVLHFLSDAEDPWQIVATLRDALAPGSYLALSHASGDGRADGDAEVREKAYNSRVANNATLRCRAAIERFFEGFELLDPGVVFPPLWRPDSPDDVPEEPGAFWALAGVGRRT